MRGVRNELAARTGIDFKLLKVQTTHFPQFSCPPGLPLFRALYFFLHVTAFLDPIFLRIGPRSLTPYYPAQKEINALIITRFDKILVEHQEAEPRSSPAAQTKAEDGVSSPGSGSDDTTNTKKRKSSAVEDEDARLAAELHAALNSGRPTRTKAKVTKKAVPKKKRKVKSKATVDSDESGNEGGDGGEKKKKKRGGTNPNNAFNVRIPPLTGR